MNYEDWKSAMEAYLDFESDVCATHRLPTDSLRVFLLWVGQEALRSVGEHASSQRWEEMMSSPEFWANL